MFGSLPECLGLAVFAGAEADTVGHELGKALGGLFKKKIRKVYWSQTSLTKPPVDICVLAGAVKTYF